MVPVLECDMHMKLHKQGCNCITSHKVGLPSKEVHGLCNQSINAQQLQHMANAIAQKRQELTDVMFLHHNTQPDVAKLTCHLYSGYCRTTSMVKRWQLQLMMNWKLQLVTSLIASQLNFTRVSMTYPVIGSRWSKIMLITLMQLFPNDAVCIIGAAKEDCRWGRMI